MSILDKLMSDYTHAVHYETDLGDRKEYRCKAASAQEALSHCVSYCGFEIQSCAVIPKEDNEGL